MSKKNQGVEDLKLQSTETLSSNLFKFKKDLFNLRFQKTLGELKDTSKFVKVKKNIARVKTEISKRLKVEK